MRIIPFSLMMTALSFMACGQKERPMEGIIIEGWIKDLPDGKLYLMEAHNWKVPLDSAIAVQGHFRFDIRTDSSFVPYMASIYRPMKDSSRKLWPLAFRNYAQGADSMKYSNTAFYLEKGYTRIISDTGGINHLRIFAGKETDVLFRNPDFGWPRAANNQARKEKLDGFKKQIRKYPFSYFLLASIYNYRSEYSEEELRDLFKEFGEEVRSSAAGRNFLQYLVTRIDPGEPYPALSLADSLGRRHALVDTASSLNMIVFWASWCGPCRKEIPQLKELAKNWAGKGVHLVSVSIDRDRASWIDALKQEKMNWPQYLADADSIEKIEHLFNFNSIPLVVFTDARGRELKRFMGFQPGRENTYGNFLRGQLGESSRGERSVAVEKDFRKE